MWVSIRDAARLLGWSERQVRYQIKKGALAAKKENGQWRIEREDLPLSKSQVVARERKLSRAVETAKEVFGDREPSNEKAAYSVLRLKAFLKGRELLAKLGEKLGPDHPACQLLNESLTLLTIGCHEFSAAEKAMYFRQARERTSRAVAHLLLASEPDEEAALELEKSLLPSFGGLIRRTERRKKS